IGTLAHILIGCLVGPMHGEAVGQEEDYKSFVSRVHESIGNYYSLGFAKLAIEERWDRIPNRGNSNKNSDKENFYRSSQKDNEDEEALKWTTLEKVPTYG
ncbi:hypothetical protein U1Q18_049261, partial [Sarracenia purpurea var. burkii]